MSKSAQATMQKTVNSGFVPGFLFMLKTVLISYILSVALLFATALVATFNPLSDTTISITVNIITAFGVFLCGFLSGRHFNNKGIIYGALCGILYSILLCLIGNLASQNIGFSSAAITALSIGVICGAVGGIVGINTKHQQRR